MTPRKLRACYCTLAAVCLLTLSLHAQEDCANGRDDDNDGLIDLNDTADCGCGLAATVTSLLPNPSLENYASDQPGCTSGQPGGLPDDVNQANCVVGWQRVSLGTTDIWNAFTLAGAPPSFPASLPQPLPSGTSVAGFWVGVRDVLGIQFRNGDGSPAYRYREYLAAGLTDGKRLRPGTDYHLEFSLGFMLPQDLTVVYSDEPIHLSSPDSIELAVYGVTELEHLDFGEFYDCPEASGAEGYELITTLKVSGQPGGWTSASVDFTSYGEYAGFAIGGSCAADLEPPGGGRYRNYYFIDNLILNETAAFELPVAGPVAVTGQTLCADEIVLTGLARSGASYQWYRNGAALPGQDGVSLILPSTPDIDGVYRLRVTTDRGCAVTDPVRIQRPVMEDQFPDSVSLCYPGNDLFIYPKSQRSADYNWSDGTTGPSFHVSEPGTYSVTITSACVERVESFVAVDDRRPTYEFQSSPAVPCAGDTVELSMQSDWYARLTAYFLPDGTRLTANAQGGVRIVAGEVSHVDAIVVGSCGLIRTSIAVPVREPFQPQVSISDVNCHGPEGSVTVSLPEGAFADYRWTDSAGRSLDTTAYLAVDRPGDYTLILDGAEHCTTEVTYTVGDNDGFALMVDASETVCGNDATALAIPAGGHPPYRIDWYREADEPAILEHQAVAYRLDRGNYRTTVTDRIGCSLSTEFAVRGPDPLQLTATGAYPGCSADSAGSIQLSATGGTTPYLFALSGSDRLQGEPQFSGLVAGAYRATVTDDNNCSARSTPVELTMPPPVTVDAGPNRTSRYGQRVALSGQVSGRSAAEGSATWTVLEGGSDTGVSWSGIESTVYPKSTTRYRLEFVSDEGCVGTDTVAVTVLNDKLVYAPNAFSPNGDGRNDEFTLLGGHMVGRVSDLRIFDRWGGLVYVKPADGPASWDGTRNGRPLGTGAYVYRAAVTYRDGTREVVEGTVSLLR